MPACVSAFYKKPLCVSWETHCPFRSRVEFEKGTRRGTGTFDLHQWRANSAYSIEKAVELVHFWCNEAMNGGIGRSGRRREVEPRGGGKKEGQAAAAASRGATQEPKKQAATQKPSNPHSMHATPAKDAKAVHAEALLLFLSSLAALSSLLEVIA